MMNMHFIMRENHFLLENLDKWVYAKTPNSVLFEPKLWKNPALSAVTHQVLF